METYKYTRGKGTDITDSDLIQTATPFGFSVKKLTTIIEQTDDVLANYGKYMKELGVK